MQQHSHRLLFLPLLFLISGCLTQEKTVTKEEAMEFAKTLEASVKERNPNVFNNIFDGQTLKNRIKAAGGGKLQDNVLSELPEILKKKRLGDVVIQASGKYGMYQLVKSYEKDGKQHVIFRLYGNMGLNYHDIELIHVGKEVKAADMYIYITGENFSKTLADALFQLSDYFKTNPDEQNVVKSISEMRKLTADEKYSKALEIYETLPDTLKKQKFLQLLHVQMSAKLENNVYKQAVDEYSRLYPNEPGMYILFLNIHFVHEEYEKALDDVNKMDSLINRDPFLDYFRGLVYKAMKNDSTAQTYFERLYKNMPEFGDGIIELIAIHARKGEMGDANALVKVYRNNKKLNQENITMLSQLYPNLEKE